ncbi:hypothetical protein L2729_07665 [Shewanella gelidimarina]|uniref:hypothetical protein n=1 Tax=Shewanella gelidimarina TaxID=56813 RepID=UPI0020107B2A|nr:hypothetical protein [Shewanella gelidimarina]MCL1057880.1 hypothetical protein [Shewanella gelidimarina]
MFFSIMILIVSTIFSVFVILYKLKHNGYTVFFDSYLLILVFSLLYFNLPSFFVTDLNMYYRWGISLDSMVFSNLLVSFSTVFLSVSLVFSNSDKNKIHINALKAAKPNVNNKTLIFVVFIILCVFLLVKLKDIDFSVLSGTYSALSRDEFSKSVAYFTVSVVVLTYFRLRSFIVLTPLFAVILLDISSGTRSAALVCMLTLIYIYIYSQKKIPYIATIILILILLLVGLLRAKINSFIPTHIILLGEMGETFITLPKLILDGNYVGHGTVIGVIASLFFALLQPYRLLINETYTFSGPFMAEYINRGYGFASNYIIDSLYLGYYGFPLVLMCIFIYCRVSNYIMNSTPYRFVLMYAIFNCFIIRLIVREGFFGSVGLYMFLLLFYIISLYVFDKVCFDK